MDGSSFSSARRIENGTIAKEVVVTYLSRLGTPMLAHEEITLTAVAKAIAQIKNSEFAGCYDDAADYSGAVFFVPDDTLMPDEASRLGIRGPNDLFGGVVPYPVAKTKAITHQLANRGADHPEGWSSVFAEKVRDVVLPGYTAFSVRDAQVAAMRMLPRGPIRLKNPLSCGGRGQAVVARIDEMDAFVEKIPADDIAASGVVLEANLREVTTRSIGQVTIGDTTVSYHGTQRVVADNEERSVYGGSDLVCVRGDWDVLNRLPMTAEVRLGIIQARSYEAAMSEYPGFLASRRNHDVGQGVDGAGRWRSGVLEAAWRTGGASTAELAALAAFVHDPALQVVEVSAVKEFGRNREAPRDAVVHFCGDDPQDGPILRYTVVTRTHAGPLEKPIGP